MALKSAERGWKFYLEKFWPFSGFVILQIRFCNHQGIKISMIYMYIKPEVKKMIQQQWCSYKWSLYYMKIGIWWGGFFWCGNWAFFFLAAGWAQSIGFGGRGMAVDTWLGNKQDERTGNFFGKIGNTGGIIQGNNSAEPWFVLRDLIPMNFFK